MQNRASRNSGIVLLIVLGILGLLSVLAVSFVSMARLERSISSNYLLRVKAVMGAESGVEAAIARLSSLPAGATPADEYARMIYGHSTSDTAGFPDLPSWNSDVDGDGAPDGVSGLVEGTLQDGVCYALLVDDNSGKLNLNDSNNYVNWDDDYFEDTPWPAPDPGLWYDPNPDDDNLAKPHRLYQILDYLVERLFGEPAAPTGIGGLVASAVIALRESLPGGIITEYSQLRDCLVEDVLGPGLTEEQYAVLLKHVTLHSWQDPNVIKPTYKYDIPLPLDGMDEWYVPTPDWANVAMWRDRQTKGFALEPRSPVNVNTASVELLEALIAPVQGWAFVEHPMESSVASPDWLMPSQMPRLTTPDLSPVPTNHIYGPWQWSGAGGTFGGSESYLGRMRLTPAVADPRGIARRIHDRIHKGEDVDGDGVVAPDDPAERARGFSTWSEFDVFLRASVPSGMFASYPADMGFDDVGLTPVDSLIGGFGGATEQWAENYFHDFFVDALLANFNPNSRLNDYNPNRTNYVTIDKAHLANYTTELCFEPLSGSFDIVSRGEVRSGGRGQAAYLVSTTVRVFETLRITTQEQFLQGLEHCEDVTERLGARGGALRTAFDAQLISYPEPLKGDDPYLSPYDGSLSLSPLRPDPKDYPGDPGFVADFEKELKPRETPMWGSDRMFHYEAPPFCIIDGFMLAMLDIMMPGHNFQLNQAISNYPSACNLLEVKRLTNPIAEEEEPGLLYADGGFSTLGRTLNYDVKNIGGQDGRVGAIMFWVKPAFHTGMGGRPRKLFTFYRRHGNEGTFGSSYINGRFLRELAVYYFPHSSPEQWGGPMPEDNVSTHPDFFWGDDCDTSWLPDHSFFAHCRMGGSRWAIHSPTVSHDSPSHNLASGHNEFARFDFEHHVWNHVGFSWRYQQVWDKFPQAPGFPVSGPCSYEQLNTISSVPDSSLNAQPSDVVLSINGREVTSSHVECFNFQDPPVPNGYHNAVHYWQEWIGMQSNAHQDLPAIAGNDPYNEPGPYFRLGDFSINRLEMGAESSGFMGFSPSSYPADCTYANVAGYNAQQSYDVFNDEWRLGRYYAEGDAVYTSPALSPCALLGRGAGPAQQVELRSVSWTLYWARHNREIDALRDNLLSSVINGSDPVDPTVPNGWDPIAIDVEHSNYGWAFEGYENERPTFAGGSSLRIAPAAGRPLRFGLGDTFRFRCAFNLRPGQRVYESPVLDDVTFTFNLVKPEILNWKSGAIE